MTYQIVEINVSQTIGATPNNLQQRGCVLGFGSTLFTSNKPFLLIDKGEINDYVRNPIASYVSVDDTSGGESGQSAAGASSDVEAAPKKSRRELAAIKRAAAPLATSTDYLLTVGDGRTFTQTIGSKINVTIAGCSPDLYNGTYQAEVKSTTTIQFTITTDGESTDPGTTADGPSTLGYFMLEGASDVEAALKSFFAQGQSIGCYLLDFGTQTSQANQIKALSDYLADPETRMYGYVVPSAWDGDDNFIQLAKEYTANDALTYFFIVTQQPNSSQYTSPYKSIKSVVATVDVTAPETNMAAAFMYLVVSSDPSPVNKVAPFAFRYVQGATAVDYKNSLTAALKEQYVNWVQTGAEGGISQNIFAIGVASDGNDFAYWYSVDWIQINVHLALANAVINGSNNPINPLYYDQDGIDRLQQKAQQTFNTGVSYGLVNGAANVNAISFREYVRINPNDYAIGRYAGLSAEYTPQRGFLKIIFNINVNLNPSPTSATATA